MIQTTDFEIYYSAMTRFGIEVSGVRMLEAMEDALGILLEETQSNIPVDSGALMEDANQKIIDFSPGNIVQGGVSMMKDGVQKVYAWQRDQGGAIFPKPDNPTGRLWWVDKGTGKLISAKFVIQNGSFYMENSLENKKDVIVEKLASAVTGAFEIFE